MTGVLMCFHGLGRAVGPFAHRNEERDNWLPGALLGKYRQVVGNDGGAGEVCAPGSGIGFCKIEHHMRMPVANGVVQATLLGHHVGHRTRFGQHELICRELGPGASCHFRRRDTCENPPSSFEISWKDGTCGGMVVACRRAGFWAPKLGVGEAFGPGSFHQADETVISHYRSHITMAAERQYIGIGRDRRRRRTARQHNLRCGIGLKVARKGSHGRIRLGFRP